MYIWIKEGFPCNSIGIFEWKSASVHIMTLAGSEYESPVMTPNFNVFDLGAFRREIKSVLLYLPHVFSSNSI